MHEIDLILTLTAGLGFALLCAFLAVRLKLPAIVGYLVAGLVVGPYTPGFVANRGIAEQLAEIGVILLMFGVGLDFHFKDLVAARRIAITGALSQILIASAVGILAGWSFGWTNRASLVFAIALSVASTVVLTRVLTESGDLHSQTGRIAIGWLVVEDLFTVFVMVVLPVVLAPASSATGLAAAIGITALKLVILTALILGAGGKLIPKILAAVSRLHSRELFTLTALVIALGIAVLAAKLFGISMALGAFLAGMVVGQSEFSHRAASEALPMRDAFAVLFFVSVGMLFDPEHLLRAPGQILVTTAIVLLVKPLAALSVVLLLGYGLHVGVRVAIALAQIGEFSFILAALGSQLGMLPPGAMHSLVIASIVSITLNPILYRLVPAIEKRLGRWAGTKASEVEPSVLSSASAPTIRHTAVVVGYGPVGQTITSLLEQRGMDAVIVDLNVETVRELKKAGKRAVHGDASHAGILEQAGIQHARELILTIPSSPESVEMIRVAREMNRFVRVLARSSYLSECDSLRRAGADGVFSAEAEISMAMIQHILEELGMTPEQMDRERARVRTGLYGQHETS